MFLNLFRVKQRIKDSWTGLIVGVLVFAFGVPAAVFAGVTEHVIHSFGYGTDGSSPTASLTYVNGELYGTTSSGGANVVDGTVFKLNPDTGAEKVLYSFCSEQNCADGVTPLGNLIEVAGTLYSTTQIGGAFGYGTVFALDPKTGAESVVCSFGSNPHDGSEPDTGVIDVDGKLYGTTRNGGSYYAGTVFACDPRTGKKTLVHSFSNQSGDGGLPEAGLINVNGTLYGTTWEGSNSDGTVFAFDPKSGAETVLYAFPTNRIYGMAPNSSVIDVKSVLYGTTYYGGIYGYGTAFAFDLTTHTETVLHSFGSGTDGTYPSASLIYVDGKLYGTTEAGGTGSGCNSIGCGTVFAIDIKSGAEKILHSFCTRRNCADGLEPLANLIAVAGTLYGTTLQGGTGQNCFSNCGTVFALARP